MVTLYLCRHIYTLEYSDRILDTITQPTTITLSIWYYRALILIWSVWVAFSLIKWLKWAWFVFTKDEVWSKKEKK